MGVVVMVCPLMVKTILPPEFPGPSWAVNVMGVRAGAGLRLEVRVIAGPVLPTGWLMQVAGA